MLDLFNSPPGDHLANPTSELSGHLQSPEYIWLNPIQELVFSRLDTKNPFSSSLWMDASSPPLALHWADAFIQLTWPS